MSERIARILSIVLHPIATLLLLVAVAAGRSRVLLLAIAIGFVPMIAVIVWQTRTRRWKNVDASVPTERHVLFGASLVFVLLLAAALRWWSPQPQAARGALAVGAIFATAWALLRWMKLSLHVAFAAFAAASLAFIDQRIAIAMLVAVPWLAWARLRMKRHTMREVIGGAALGLVAGLFFSLSGGS